MAEGWRCPNCGKAHAPSVMTCPEPESALYPYKPFPGEQQTIPTTVMPIWPYGPTPVRKGLLD